MIAGRSRAVQFSVFQAFLRKTLEITRGKHTEDGHACAPSETGVLLPCRGEH